MNHGGYDLPEDNAELRRFARQLIDELYAAQLHVKKLILERAVANRARFGRSSERLVQEAAQLVLAVGDTEMPPAIAEMLAEAADTQIVVGNDNAGIPTSGNVGRVQRGRQPFPSHLPVETIELPLCSCPHCGGERFSKVGETRRRFAEYVPASMKIVEYVLEKLSCRACERIVQAPMPPMPVERGRAGPNLLAHIAVSKYDDHQPLERQSKIVGRTGIKLSRQALCGYLGGIAPWLAPLAAAIGHHVRAGEVFHIDDTPMPVLEKGAVRPARAG